MEIQERMDMVKEWVLYNRVSTEDQAETLVTQENANLAVMKNKYGITKKPIKIFSEQASGTDPKREKWLEMIDWVLSYSKPEELGVGMADFNRWSRQTFSGPTQAGRLYNAGVSIYAFEESAFTGTPKIPNPQGDLLFSVQMGFGAYGREVGRARTIAGVEESRKKGVMSGTIKNLYPEKPNFSFRKALKMIKEVDKKERTWSGVMTHFGFKRLNLTPAQVKKGQKIGSWSNVISYKLNNFLKEVESKLGKKGLENYLKVTDKIIDMERKHGTGRNNKSNVKMWAVRRASSLYVGKPWEYVERMGDHILPEDIDIHFQNFEDYLPKRR